MKHITLFIAALLVSIGAMAQNVDYDFASGCGPGHTLYYKILSSNPPQAEVVYGEASPQGGDLIIPEMAADTTHTFRLYEVVSIADKAFKYFNFFSEKAGILVIPNTVLTIGEESFHLSAFTNIALSESLVSIGNYAFYNVFELTEPLVIPNSVTSIGNLAFCGCGFTGTLVVPYSVTSIGRQAFYGCGFSSLDWQAQLTEIPESCFYECQFSGMITLPEGLTKIGKEAFAKCEAMTGLELPSTLNNIGYLAFGGCSGLTYIKIDALMPPYSPPAVFSYVDFDIPVHVPCGTKPLYEETPGWTDFTNIIDDLDAVNELETDDFAVYPNPVADQLHVSCQGLNLVTVYDAQGRKISSMEAENEDACLDFSKQASGVYFVIVTTAEGRKKASRVVKQ